MVEKRPARYRGPMSQEFWVGVWLVSVAACTWVGYRGGDVIRGAGAGILLGPLGFVLLLWFDSMDERHRQQQDNSG